MTTSLASDAVQQALQEAAARATLAPSIHNSQPWRLIVRPGRLDFYADQTRRASVIDPTGRQLAISCGAALFGVRVALAAAQIDAVTTLLPKPSEPDLLAATSVIGMTASPDEDARRLDTAALTRRSNRRRFTTDPVPDSLTDTLVHAAEVEGAWLHPIRELDDRVMVAVLSQRAEALQNADPDYRAELRSWTSGDPDRTDGVPAAAIPHTTGGAHDDIPIRDFDTDGAGALPTETRSSLTQTMFVLGADGDDMRSWLIAGQALGRVLLVENLALGGLVRPPVPRCDRRYRVATALVTA
ncbi:MAG: Acg family FMN-binding oxidoreductase [Geodermatophilaceae bacterium]